MIDESLASDAGVMHLRAVTPRIALLILVLLHASSAGAGIPSLLAETATKGGFSDSEIAAAANLAQARVYEPESTGRQVTVIGIVRIPASAERITKDLRSRNGLLKSPSLQQIGVFSDPAKMSDLAEFRMPESDIETLVDCEVGDCKFKVAERGIETLDAIDWDAPDAYDRVNALMKEGMLAYVLDFETRGNAALMVSADKEEPQSFAEGSKRLTGQLGLSEELIPKLREHLSRYPKAGIPGAQDRILWTIRDYGYRPVTSILHSVVYEPGEESPVATLVVLKTLYANHYFHARQRLIGLWPDTEDPNSTWVGYSDRLLFDGDVGSIKRRMLQSGVTQNGQERIERLRKEYE
jgi:hypothetical protein